jgi:hypothetical protein
LYEKGRGKRGYRETLFTVIKIHRKLSLSSNALFIHATSSSTLESMDTKKHKRRVGKKIKEGGKKRKRKFEILILESMTTPREFASARNGQFRTLMLSFNVLFWKLVEVLAKFTSVFGSKNCVI